ncbi:MAG: type V CRISPR-associated protein Cas12a/Cpf1 [Paludibacter sp.]|nr:type V CRISPR-associated protein Cas12a/Cpf1 [Paludibacter sp.]
MNNLNEFTGLYPISKTLRFELKPIGRTLEYIEKNDILKNDNQRADDYKEVKQIIDGFHKWFIDDALKNLNLDWNALRIALENYKNGKSETDKKILEETQKKKRKELFTAFKNHNAYEYLFKEDLLSNLLPTWIESSEDSDSEKKNRAVQTFHRFSTYFTGFHENRKNIYSDEAISTSVSYRITHDNFPKFLANLEVFQTLKSECPEVLLQTSDELAEYMNGVEIDDVFSIEFFNGTFTQEGINFYNRILSGVSPENGMKKRGLNEFVNLYRQQHPDFVKNKKATKMVLLFKQILSDRETLSFIPEMFANDKQVQDSIYTFYNSEIQQFEKDGQKINVCDKLANIVSHITDYDESKLYINLSGITQVSQKLFGSWLELNACLFKLAESKFGTVEKVANKKKIDKWLKTDEFSFTELNTALELSDKNIQIQDYFSNITIVDEENSIRPNKIVTKTILIGDYVKYIGNKYEKEIKYILEKDYSKAIHLREQTDDVELLKVFLDSLQEFMHTLKPLCVSEETDRDASFYNEFDVLYNQLTLIVPLYNKVRNYITQKMGEESKIKLNFENPTLADGWDANKEEANTCVLFLKKNNYYLGVMNAKNKPKLATAKAKDDEPSYQKMVYKYFKDITTMIPKCSTQLKAVKEHFSKSIKDYILYDAKTFSKELCITKEVYDLNNQLFESKKKFQKDYFKATSDSDGYKKAVFDWISFCMNFLKSYKSTEIYDYSTLSSIEKYESVDVFYSEVNKICYTISFTNIPDTQINEWVEEGKLFLFQIYSKDFAAGTTGRPNLHTLYWKNLFTPENLNNVVLKLNGQAELFYRESIIKKPASHKVGEKMVNRRDINHKPIPDAIHRELFLHHNNRNNTPLSEEAKAYEHKIAVKNVSHEIVKDQRFTKPKFLFHVPMTINFKADVKNEYMNEGVRKFLGNNPDINIIGLDRGERHLIYLTLTNLKGEILKQKTFNTVNDTDYQEKLVQREKERDGARKSWGTIGKIKELKEGYLSVVIHEIATMMVKNNAIVVLEDLNFGFKRGRFKVERQVYQKFEKMLIDKLNYLVFKEKSTTEAGGVLNGYQLTEKFTSFKDLGKQSGFLFYVPAAYTSKIDPTTGFVNLLNLNYTNIKDAQILLGNMDSIRYNTTEKYFEFALNYDNFKTPQTDYRKQWTVCTVGEKRFAYVTTENGQKETKTINVTESLIALFEKNGIDFADGKDIITLICQQTEAKFYERLLWVLKLTMQMRNSNAATGEDFILSPVKNSKGEFFKSNGDENGSLPADADANGAYHIALKGLYLLEKVFAKGNKEMKIEHKEWFEFAQKRHLKE